MVSVIAISFGLAGNIKMGLKLEMERITYSKGRSFKTKLFLMASITCVLLNVSDNE